MVDVSVVVPVHNDAALLGGCLAALADQDRPPQEVVIVDNASTDGLPEVLADHADLPLRRVTEGRLGIPYAAATGYDAAIGDVILRCDADSRPPGDWISRHVRTLQEAGPGVVGVSGIARNGERVTAPGRLAGLLYITVYRVCANVALGHHALWGSNMAIRSSWWRRARAGVHLRRDVHDDFDLSFRLEPGERLLVDRRSVMPVSWRALVSPGRIWRQARWAVTTVAVNWSGQPYWPRLYRRWSPGTNQG